MKVNFIAKKNVIASVAKQSRLLIFFILISTSSVNAIGIRKFFKRNEYKDSKKHLNDKGSNAINIVFISHANLYLAPAGSSFESMEQEYQVLENKYPKLDHNPDFTWFSQKLLAENYLPNPTGSSKILYKESEVLLQESIRELLRGLEQRSIDLVIFGGNQVYSTKYMRFFDEIAFDLQRYSVSNYQIIGPNELRGPEDISKSIKDSFYLLRTKKTNILVLDNVSEKIIPEHLPEEATQQYLWLNKTLDRIQISGEDLLVFSFNPLEQKTIDLFNSFPHLNLKVVAHSQSGEFNTEKAISFRHMPHPLLISNTSLSWYPCAYSIITKDEFGNYKAHAEKLGLKGMQELARSKL